MSETVSGAPLTSEEISAGETFVKMILAENPGASAFTDSFLLTLEENYNKRLDELIGAGFTPRKARRYLDSYTRRVKRNPANVSKGRRPGPASGGQP